MIRNKKKETKLNDQYFSSEKIDDKVSLYLIFHLRELYFHEVLRNSQESSSFVKIYKINKHKICTLFKLWYSKNLICQLYFKLCTVLNFDICVAKTTCKEIYQCQHWEKCSF